MSAQITLADAEMEALVKALLALGVADMGEGSLSDAESAAATRAYRKLRKALDRPSRRRRR